MNARSRSFRSSLSLGAAAAVLIPGCDVATLSPDERAAFSTAVEAREFTLTARLGALATSRASGGLTLFLRNGDASDWEMRVDGFVMNPTGETFTDAAVHPVPRDPDPPFFGAPLITLFDNVRVSCTSLRLTGRGTLDAAIARRIVADPGAFAAVLSTAELPGGALLGVFSNPGPPNRPGHDTAPAFPPNPCIIEVNIAAFAEVS